MEALSGQHLSHHLAYVTMAQLIIKNYRHHTMSEPEYTTCARTGLFVLQLVVIVGFKVPLNETLNDKQAY